MPTGEDVLQMRSDNSGDTDENSDTPCNYCNTKVGKSVVKCIKCVGVFHLSCLMKAANRKNTDCRHEMIPDKADDEYSLIKNENKFLKMEVTYLRALLEEANSKNLVLIENNKLLNEKISNIETNIKTSRKNSDENSKTTKTTSSSNADKQTSLSYSSMLSKGSGSAHDAQTPQEQASEDVIVNVNVNNRLTQQEINNEINTVTDSQVIKTREDGWTKVRGRKTRERKTVQKIYGTKTNDQNTTIQGAIRRRWIYVGKIAGRDVSEKDIASYLESLNESEQFIVKKQKTIGQNSSFCIGVTQDAYNKIFDESFWPQGIVVRDFNFDKQFFRKRDNKRNPQDA